MFSHEGITRQLSYYYIKSGRYLNDAGKRHGRSEQGLPEEENVVEGNGNCIPV